MFTIRIGFRSLCVVERPSASPSLLASKLFTFCPSCVTRAFLFDASERLARASELTFCANLALALLLLLRRSIVAWLGAAGSLTFSPLAVGTDEDLTTELFWLLLQPLYVSNFSL